MRTTHPVRDTIIDKIIEIAASASTKALAPLTDDLLRWNSVFIVLLYRSLVATFVRHARDSTRPSTITRTLTFRCHRGDFITLYEIVVVQISVLDMVLFRKR